MTPYLQMALNNAWANATLYGAVTGLTKDEFTAPRTGFFPSLAATLNHIYEVDLYYLDALEAGGLGRSVYEREPVLSARDLGQAQAGADMRFAKFCGLLTPALLEETRDTERPNETVKETVGALVLHLIQHQIHHRGQAHTMLVEAGIAPPQLDDFYLEYARAPSAKAYFS